MTPPISGERKTFNIKTRFIDIIIWIGIVSIDIIVYIILGLLLMDYDDTYNSSRGEYWRLDSMTSTQKIIYFGLLTWNIINIIGVIYVVRKIYKLIKYGTKNTYFNV